VTFKVQIRSRRVLALTSASAITALVVLLAASVARAGDAYVLDIARQPVAPATGPGIVRLSDQLRYTLNGGPGVEPLQEPVGIDYDEASETLLVTDSEGYHGTYGGDACVAGGCGALLRINPATNPAQVTLISGPGRAPGGNTWENPYGVLDRPGVGDILVSDTSSNRIVSVDPATGAQTQFNQPSGYTRGLRNPWGMSIDPTNGDVLVMNNGNPSGPPVTGAEFGPGFTLPSRCGNVGKTGYVVRYSPTGQPLTMYCAKVFSRPRDVLVNGDGVIFALDPITYAANPGIGFGTLFRINPTRGFVKPITSGGSMATPSGLDFNAAGSHLVVADETLFPYAGPCPDGCGGVLQINADGGEQTILARRGAGAWVDPIDIAVDRDGQQTPTLKTQTVPEFLHLNRDEGQATPTSDGASVPLFPLQEGSVVSVYCVGDKGCPGHKERSLIKRYTVPADKSQITLTVTGGGSPTASISRCKHWPACRTSRKYSITASDGQRHKHRAKRSVEAAAAKKKHKKKQKRKKPSAQRDNGRYYDFVLTSDPKQVVRITRSGCLKPGETTVSRKKPKTVIDCPAP
jgi:sugar lactone lactonase YvrE